MALGTPREQQQAAAPGVTTKASGLRDCVSCFSHCCDKILNKTGAYFGCQLRGDQKVVGHIAASQGPGMLVLSLLPLYPSPEDGATCWLSLPTSVLLT